ncbi:hypothetical protein [Pelagerythrobacter sp.]|uniref:hypothetical protein n=1 Tax=Pelagerythrobacter sp. TaxID=2800702 RepID=UPI0035B334C9
MNQAAMNAKMYRHFAVVTVCLTAGLAIFADGESRQAVADEIAAHEAQTDLERAEVAKFGQPKLLIGSGQPAQSASFDYGGGGGAYGAPMDPLGGSDRSASSAPRRNTTTRAGTGIDYAALGLSKAQFDELDPATQQELLRQFHETRARQTRSLLEGSAARGGGVLEL